MQIHRIRGRDLRDALERARKLHGDRALVLGHEPLPGGGVTVAVSDQRPPVVPVVPRALSRKGSPAGPATPPGLDDVTRVLERSGTSQPLIDETLAAVRASGSTGAFALDAAARFLGQRLEIAPSPKVPGRGKRGAPRPVIAFVGPTGVGKTTTIAKLASMLVRSGRRVGLVAMDVQRPGAVGQLEAFGELLQTPVEVARDGAELARLVERTRRHDAVLVDTTGRSPRDARALEVLRESLAGPSAAELTTYLVLTATSGRGALAEIEAGFESLAPDGIVITKLDETRRPAEVLEHALAHRRSIAFLADGQDVAGHLHRPRPDHLADLFLRGRLS